MASNQVHMDLPIPEKTDDFCIELCSGFHFRLLNNIIRDKLGYPGSFDLVNWTNGQQLYEAIKKGTDSIVRQHLMSQGRTLLQDLRPWKGFYKHVIMITVTEPPFCSPANWQYIEMVNRDGSPLQTARAPLGQVVKGVTVYDAGALAVAIGVSPAKQVMNPRAPAFVPLVAASPAVFSSQSGNDVPAVVLSAAAVSKAPKGNKDRAIAAPIQLPASVPAVSSSPAGNNVADPGPATATEPAVSMQPIGNVNGLRQGGPGNTTEAPEAPIAPVVDLYCDQMGVWPRQRFPGFVTSARSPRMERYRERTHAVKAAFPDTKVEPSAVNVAADKVFGAKYSSRPNVDELMQYDPFLYPSMERPPWGNAFC